MIQSGIFIDYKLVEALNLVNKVKVNSKNKDKVNAKLKDLKRKWRKSESASEELILDNKTIDMTNITLDALISLNKIVKSVDTFTVSDDNFYNGLIMKKNKTYDFKFEHLEKVVSFARKNNKKLIIDSSIVTGDTIPSKLDDLSKSAVKNVIEKYIEDLTKEYGDVIERINVLQDIFRIKEILPNNNVEEFWINLFGKNYAREIIKTVKKSINTKFPDIKLCWNEFYLTNSKYKERKDAFLENLNIKGLDVIGIQDRFVSNESVKYIITALDDITEICSSFKKDVAITNFSCLASINDLKKFDIEEINYKITNLLNSIYLYSKKSDVIKSIEGPISDNYDYSHAKLKEYGYNISTTGNKMLIERLFIRKDHAGVIHSSNGSTILVVIGMIVSFVSGMIIMFVYNMIK